MGKEEHGSSKCHACQSSAIRTGGKEHRDIKEGDRGVFSFGFRQENGARINANDTQANPVGVQLCLQAMSWKVSRNEKSS